MITDAELYFGEGKHPIDALKIWHGGLGIWGAVGFGALGAWIACRRAKVPFLAVADAMAPGIALAQVVGRFGNYFNQELFGSPTTAPWGLEIDPAHRPDGYAGLRHLPPDVPVRSGLEPRRGRTDHPGRRAASSSATDGRSPCTSPAYTAGRAWIEHLRIDTVNHFLGLRLNVWTAIILFVLGVVAFVISANRTSRARKTSRAGPRQPARACRGRRAGRPPSNEPPRRP